MFGEVPDIWKEALVTAIPKVAGAQHVSQYRPISITCTPIKTMERIVRDKLLSWLLKCRLIPTEQHGFLPGLSTATNLVDCVYDWKLALNKGMSVDVVYIDLSKAFDRVNHDKLIHKLDRLGIRGKLLNWMVAYLRNRNSTVKVGCEFSERFSCPTGVPQGGVLSPLLFLIYTLDLPTSISTHSSVTIKIYADDIKIYAAYKSEDAVEVCSALEETIDKLNNYASRWDLRINLEKCCVLHLGRSNNRQYEVDGVVLKKLDCVRDLGVMVDARLNFSEHIKLLVRNAYAALFLTLRSVHTKDPAILTRLYLNYVVPHLEYCSQVWNPKAKWLSDLIEGVQKTFTKMVFYRAFGSLNIGTMPSYPDRLKQLGLKSLYSRRVMADLAFCFRILRCEIGLPASKYWIFKPCNGRRGVFSLQHRFIYMYSYGQLHEFLLCRVARWFRMLPPEVMMADTSKSFKAKLSKIDVLSILNVSG